LHQPTPFEFRLLIYANLNLLLFEFIASSFLKQKKCFD
jgi:hypothetical protein